VTSPSSVSAASRRSWTRRWASLPDPFSTIGSRSIDLEMITYLKGYKQIWSIQIL
jgi:hypothetical protein